MRLWNSKPLSLILVGLVLGIVLLMPGIGVIPAFVIALVAALVGRKAGSFRDMGFRAPESWLKLLGVTAVYGLVLQLVFIVVIEPVLEGLTGSPVDISAFDSVRGNFVMYLFMTAIGWVMGGFLEEFTFRGFVVSRVRDSIGGSSATVWLGILASAIVFGLAHEYQGPSGMIATGLAGLIFGAMYLWHGFNIWYPILAHGFVNTVGAILVYFDVDRQLGELLF